MKSILVLLIVLLRGYFINGNDSDVLKSVLNELKDLKARVVQLESEVSALKDDKNDSQMDTEDNLEGRVEKLEQLSKFKTLRTCQELASRGLTLSGLYEVD